MAPSLRAPTDVHGSALLALPTSNHPHPHNAYNRARFPSLTEFPDSPSVYSHAYPSPDIDLHADTLSHLARHPAGPDSGLSDETASTICSLSTEGLQDDSDVDDFTDDASHRISLQGPKIRFHSRAPWETDDLIPHPEEPDISPRSGTFGRKLKGKAARADSLIRTFTRGSSLAGRPSIDSTRSQSSSTSFEIPTSAYSNTRGVLYDLARQSMSTTSLSSSTTSSTRNQRTLNYPEPSSYIPHTHGSLSRATVSLDGMAPPSLPLETVPTRSSSSDVSRIGRERTMKPFPVRSSQERHSSHDDFVHPYANPDLVVPSYTPSSETIPSHHPIPEDMSGSDSNCTITDSISVRSAAFSSISPKTSTTSLTSREGNLRVNGKEISSPICVLHQHDGSFVGRNTRFLSLHPPPPGFDAPQRINPTVTLLSLQEAQARLRTNTTNTSVIRSKSSFSDAENIPETPEEENEEIDTTDPISHSRARPISAGTRQNIIPLAPSQTRLSETEESNPATSVSGRALKHKKSGFMRLFGGRNSEGEKEKGQSPPALPSDGFAELNLQVHGMAKPSRLTRPRVGKPASSPALRGSSTSNPQLAVTVRDIDSPDGKGPSVRRRQAPSLSIVTKTSDQSIATSSMGLGSPTGSNFKPSLPFSLTVPQSAPPGNGGFPGLQLRPVSGCFSSHFADIVANAAEETQRDVRTPSSAASSNIAPSPFTPISSTRHSDDASTTAMDVMGEENLTIKGLQDQLASAKKAWQQQVWELRGQIRDLTSELEDLRAVDHLEYCDVCGRGEPPKRQVSPWDEQQKKVSVVDRPRARTGHGARFANGT